MEYRNNNIQIIFWKIPYPFENKEALIDCIDKYGDKLIKRTENEELDDLIKKLLEKDASKRLSWDEYLNHSFFKDKNKINIIYEKTNNSNSNNGVNNIFGEKFVENNKNNIGIILVYLIINGKKMN